MKKIILTISFLFLFLPFSVEALSGDIKVTCDASTLKQGEATACKIIASSDEEIADVDMVLNVSESLDLSDLTINDAIWETEEGSSDNNNHLLLVATEENPKGDNIYIAAFQVTAKEVLTDEVTSKDVEITLSDVEIYGADHETKGTFEVEPVSIKIVSGESNEDSTGDNNDDDENDTPVVSGIDYTGNDIIDFPDNTDGELSAYEDYNLDDYGLRYQYVGLTKEQDEVISELYNKYHNCVVGDNCTAADYFTAKSQLMKSLPAFDTEKWTDIGDDHLVSFNGHESESGNYVLFIEITDEDGNIKYAYDYVVADNIKEYVGPATSDSLPIMLIAIATCTIMAVYGYKRTRLAN